MCSLLAGNVHTVKYTCWQISWNTAVSLYSKLIYQSSSIIHRGENKGQGEWQESSRLSHAWGSFTTLSPCIAWFSLFSFNRNKDSQPGYSNNISVKVCRQMEEEKENPLPVTAPGSLIPPTQVPEAGNKYALATAKNHPVTKQYWPVSLLSH